MLQAATAQSTTNDADTAADTGKPYDSTVPFEPLSSKEFKRLLVAVIPHLRAFGFSLTGNRDTADDLAQETMMKAWAARKRFRPGTSLRAWTFVILRNTFISQMRRNRFTGEYDELVAERVMCAPAAQPDAIHLSDVQRAMLELPANQREALILVGAGGFSYEEAAEICGCAVGTIKSRVSRARETVCGILEGGRMRVGRGDVGPAIEVLRDLLRQVNDLSSGSLDDMAEAKRLALV